MFLVQFSIALHNIATYPAGHPMLDTAVDSVMARLLPLLQRQPGLALGVGRNQLIIENTATDPDNAVLRDLAERLHRHQIGILQFSDGVEYDEMADLLHKLSVDPLRQGEPLGLEREEARPDWPHIRILPLAFDQLELSDRRADDHQESRAARLWLALADAVMAGDAPETPDTPPESRQLDPSDIAQAINDQHRDESYDRVIVGYLLQLGKELSASEGADGAILKRRLVELLEGLTPSTLHRLLEIGGGVPERQDLVKTLSSTVPVKAVLDLIQAAADASRQTISHSLIRILTKLADHTTSPNASVSYNADLAFRDSVRELVDSWVLEDPNPEAYTQVLEQLARPDEARPVHTADLESEAPRIVKMSLEIDSFGPPVERALKQMTTEGQLAALLDLMEQGSGHSPTEAAIWTALGTSETLALLLAEEPPDFDTVSRLLERMGLQAAEPMLDALERAESLGTRRWLLTRLTELGPEVGPLVIARLRDTPWYVQRNMLVLLGSIDPWPDGFSPTPLAQHEDARVRREAFKLMLSHPTYRDEALHAALGDQDDAILRMALATAREGMPPPLVPRLLTLVQDRAVDPEVRAIGIRALRAVPTSSSRDWLVSRALGRKRWFRRRRLAAKSPELLAALTVLAERWADDPAGAAVLRMASRHTDPEIRGAVESGQGHAA